MQVAASQVVTLDDVIRACHARTSKVVTVENLSLLEVYRTKLADPAKQAVMEAGLQYFHDNLERSTCTIFLRRQRVHVSPVDHRKPHKIDLRNSQL